MKSYILTGLILVLVVSMSFKVQEGRGRVGSHMPPIIIYKTKADYSKYVPVTLSDDKTKITSYPAPQDVFYAGKLAEPTHLSGGYLLDNRGIGINSCFIRITYEEYSKLPQAPSPDELYKLIIDKEPFKDMYDLGPRNKFKDAEKDIDSIIKHHHLKEYKKIL